MSEPSATDWVTAISTALTAFAAFVAGGIAWAAYRRDKQAAFPIIEADIYWAAPKGANLYLILKLVIRNQLYGTLKLDLIRVRKPKGSVISTMTRSPLGEKTLAPGNSHELHSGREIVPLGSVASSYSSPSAMRKVDTLIQEFYISPPNDWGGGEVTIDLRISSKALTIRDRRITIHRRINPNPISSTDDIASNMG